MGITTPAGSGMGVSVGAGTRVGTWIGTGVAPIMHKAINIKGIVLILMSPSFAQWSTVINSKPKLICSLYITASR